jgi:UDP-2-acetamido-3-amino-2,3-dideoxy-glucuronate N-acetyltransferase
MIGQYAFIGAGAVVLRDVPDYALVMGNSAESSGGCLFVGIESISIKRTDPVYVKP